MRCVIYDEQDFAEWTSLERGPNVVVEKLVSGIFVRVERQVKPVMDEEVDMREVTKIVPALGFVLNGLAKTRSKFDNGW
jgi:hypothetical protein